MKNNMRGISIAAIVLVVVVALLGTFKLVAPMVSAPSPEYSGHFRHPR